MFERARNKKGFTLIELIVVVAILAILAAIAIPAFANITQEAEENVTLANAKMIAQAVNTHNALYPTNMVETESAAKGIEFYPHGLTGDEETAAWAKVTIVDGVATVN